MILLLLIIIFVASNKAELPRWFTNGECGLSKYANAGTYILPTPRIIGGKMARPHAFPWMISFVSIKDNLNFCGGSIINEHWIITAAHCFDQRFRNEIKVVAGEHRRDEVDAPNRQIRKIRLIVRHLLYFRAEARFDIALVKVSQPFIINEAVNPICAPDSSKDYIHNKVIVAGWGQTPEDGDNSQILRFTTLNTTSHSYCKLNFLHDPTYNIFDEMICATDNKKNVERDTCKFDSGGPLFKKEENDRFHIVGIASWGLGCAAKYPGVYTKVNFFNDWITSHINTLND